MKNKLIRSTILVFFMILLLTGMLNFAAKGLTILQGVSQGLLMATAGAVLFIAINLLVVWVRISRLYQQKKLLNASFDVTLDDTGVHITSAQGGSDTAWGNVITAIETSRQFCLFLTNTSANVLPKKQLAAPEDAETIRKVLRTYADAKKLKLK
ncbi:MAG: YcxB family protein [Clostridia bacterium]